MQVNAATGNDDLNFIDNSKLANVDLNELKELGIPIFLVDLLISNNIITSNEDLEIFKSLDFSLINKGFYYSQQLIILRNLCSKTQINGDNGNVGRETVAKNIPRYIFMNKVYEFINGFSTFDIQKITGDSIDMIMSHNNHD